MKRRPEILAPCGNMSSLKAAIAAGTDACYLAGNSFGARAYANNFSSEELLEAIDLAHLHNVKIYLTCNTLIKNSEMTGVYEMLYPLYEAGLDAVLVQDYGVMRMIREYFPGLPIHTSTQMNILTPEGARLAAERGASRVVAAREMNIRELARIKEETDIELEVFVHGAMCLCYSGRCLMSSMLGGRSGNRGRCAQPCRQRYNGEYLLSMRDFCSLRLVPELIDIGVDSLKIEGRMKNEYYTAATVEAYRTIVDAYMDGTLTDSLIERYENRLLDIFNRGGFSTGYLNRTRDEEKWDEVLIDSSMPGRRGVKVGTVSKVSDGKVHFKALKDIGSGDELLIDASEQISITSGIDINRGELVSLKAPQTRIITKGCGIYRTRSKSLIADIEALINGGRKIPVTGNVRVIKGEDLSITLSSGDTAATVKGGVVEDASNRPIDESTITNKVSQLGNTAFVMDSLKVETDNASFVRIGELSELRRKAVSELEKIVAESYRRKYPLDREETLCKLSEEMIMTDSKSNHKYEDASRSTNSLASDEKRYYIFSYPYQAEVLLDEIASRDVDLSEDQFIVIDMGLGGYDRDSILGLLKKIDKIKNGVPSIKVILGLPYINKGDYLVYDYDDIIHRMDGLYVRNIDDLAEIRNLYKDKYILLSSSLYAYNNMAVQELIDILGEDARIIFERSLELCKRDVDGINYRTEEFSQFYGKLPLMVTSGLRDTVGKLRDDKGYFFESINCEALCYNVVLGDRPLSLHDYEVTRMYYFTNETVNQVRDVLSGAPKFIKDRKYTRGHFEKGI